MMWSDDPVKDAENYLNERDKGAVKYPTCNDCGSVIDFEGYHIMGKWYCEKCMQLNYLENVQEEKE